MTKLTGIMGGMFDPVHKGHLQAALAAQKLCRLDEVIMVPCGNPVHRGRAESTAAQRCDMLKLALAGQAGFSLDTRECDSKAPSRTRDTLAAYRKERPGEILHFILGLDAFLTLPQWYCWREIFELAHLLVIARPGYDLAACKGEDALMQEVSERSTTDVATLAQNAAGKIMLVAAATPDLSSTKIKSLLHTAAAVTEFVPAAVADYIETTHLYR